jgi:chaperone modulatory protein CbpM
LKRLKKHSEHTETQAMTPNFTLITPLQVASSDLMEELTELTLSDLCRACETQADIVVELVHEGVIEIAVMEQNLPYEDWRFTGLHLHRAKVAMRLHRDLGVNFAGAALALQLMEDLREARIRIQ